MKRKILSPIYMLILALSAILPVASLAPVHAQAPTVMVNPNVVAGGLGSSFTVTVDISDVSDIVGYDVTLLFNNAALTATSADFSSPATLFGATAGGPSCINDGVVSLLSNPLGEVRSARVLLGGCTAQSPGTLMSVTFMVSGPADSPLALDSVLVAADVGGSSQAVPVTVVSGNFFLPPNVLFTAPQLSLCTTGLAVCSSVVHTKVNPAHPGSIPLECYIQLSATDLRSGFGGCVLDVRDPNGVDYISNTPLVFLFPGQSAQVEGTFSFPTSAALGTYTVFATTLNCVADDISSCVLGSTTVSAVLFKMNP